MALVIYIFFSLCLSFCFPGCPSMSKPHPSPSFPAHTISMLSCRSSTHLQQQIYTSFPVTLCQIVLDRLFLGLLASLCYVVNSPCFCFVILFSCAQIHHLITCQTNSVSLLFLPTAPFTSLTRSPPVNHTKPLGHLSASVQAFNAPILQPLISYLRQLVQTPTAFLCLLAPLS